MSERINGTWVESGQDKELQIIFWKLFLESLLDVKSNVNMHGRIKARYGSSYLRKNIEWLR